MEGGGIVLAIVGSRTCTDKFIVNETIDEFVLRHGIPKLVVSGGAKGADTLGEEWAKKHKIPIKIFKPIWKDKTGKFDRSAGIRRNTDIVNACTHMVAFPSEKGKGTQDSIQKATGQGKVLLIKWVP